MVKCDFYCQKFTFKWKGTNIKIAIKLFKKGMKNISVRIGLPVNV